MAAIVSFNDRKSITISTTKTSSLSSSSSSTSSDSDIEQLPAPGCFRGTFFGTTAAKTYLSVAVTIGSIILIGLIAARMFTSLPSYTGLYVLTAIFAVYTIAQIFGLVALFQEKKAWFIPYEVIMVLFFLINIYCLITPLFGIFNKCEEGTPECESLIQGMFTIAIVSFVVLLFHCVCMFSVVNIHSDEYELYRETKEEKAERQGRNAKILAGMGVQYLDDEEDLEKE